MGTALGVLGETENSLEVPLLGLHQYHYFGVQFQLQLDIYISHNRSYSGYIPTYFGLNPMVIPHLQPVATNFRTCLAAAALLPPWGRSGILGRSAWAAGGYKASAVAGGEPTSPL